MTNAQKDIILKLLQGHTIYGNSKYGYRVRDPDHNPVAKINPRTWRQIKHLMRREKSGLVVIDKRKVRSLHGGTWIKQTYKELLNNENEKNHDQHGHAETGVEETQPGGQQQSCTPCTYQPLLPCQVR